MQQIRLTLALALAMTLLGATAAEAGISPTSAEAGDTIRAEWVDGTLYVFGTGEDDTIIVSRYGDDLEINAGTVPIIGDQAKVSASGLIEMRGFGGNDRIEIAPWGGPLPDAMLDGGEGNDLLIGGDGVDVLRGGAGNDVLIGGRGNDVMLGEDGSDLLIWNEGNDSDTLEGGEGFDFVQVNGSNTAGDDFSIEPQSDRVRFQRNNLSLFTLDIGTTENIDVHGHGGSDVIVGSVGLQGISINGGEGDDLLVGGDGNDRIDGGAGTDLCDGGRGRDEILNCESKRR